MILYSFITRSFSTILIDHCFQIDSAIVSVLGKQVQDKILATKADFIHLQLAMARNMQKN